jgi:Rieske 2Fe-2S family protein
MAQLLATRKSNYSLPQPFYGDADFHQLDLEQIWYRNWLFAGPECAVPAAGNWFSMEVGATSLVIVRGADGVVRAIYNTCRHRGSKVCLGESGKAAKLVCPYHQWTYELDGRLLFARDMGPDFKAADFNLKQAHCRTVGGYVYVCLADVAPDFDAFSHMVEPYMLPHDLKNAKVACSATLVEQANWKLVIENNRECYHCAGNHPELLRTLSEYDSTDDPRVPKAFAERIKAKAAEWEAQGLPHTSQNAPDKRFRVVRLPLAYGESMTLDGKPAVQQLLGQLQSRDLGSVRMLSLPNSWNHLQSDHALAFRVLPLGPQTTQVTTWWLVNKDAQEGVDYNCEQLMQVWAATNDQDRVLAENNQMGINSRAYEPGPYSPTIEFGVQNFIDWYTGQMAQMQPPQPSRTIPLHLAAAV